MTKQLAIIALMLVSVSASARKPGGESGWFVYPRAGYAFISLSQTNDVITNVGTVLENALKGFSADTTNETTRAENGLIAAADLGFTFRKGSSFSFSFGYVPATQARLTVTGAKGALNYSAYATYDTTLFYFLLGGAYTEQVVEGLDSGFSAHAGYAVAGLQTSFRSVSNIFFLNSINENPEYSGGGFMAVVAFTNEFKMAEGMFLNAAIEYRFADIPRVNALKDVASMNVVSGQPLLVSVGGNPARVDFSGLGITAGVKVNF